MSAASGRTHTVTPMLAYRAGNLTWRCERGAITYGPAFAEGCNLLDGPARVR